MCADLNLKISELDRLNTAADDDLLAIVDQSNTATKKIATSALFQNPVATSAEVITGSNNKKFATPLALSGARATSAQVRTGTLTNRFVTPKALKDAEIVKISAATLAVAGKVELATVAETTTGTDATRAVTPDGLAGSSIFGAKAISIQVLQGDSDFLSGDGKAYFRVPPQLNGMNIISGAIQVITKSTTGVPTVQVARGRQGSATADFTYSDVFSTKLTIDLSEYDSRHAATQAVINAANDDLATGDVLRVDIDVQSSDAKGLNVNIICQLP